MRSWRTTSPAAFICTVQTDDYDAAEKGILSSGGEFRLPKYPLPGMAWQGYYADMEGNLFGLHQADPNSK